MLQMLRVSLLEAYPVAEGTLHLFTIDNYIRFLEIIFLMPFLELDFCYNLHLYFGFNLSRSLLFSQIKVENQMLLILLIPFWVGEIVRTYAIMIFLGNTGAVNLVLKWFGLIERPIPFMYTGFSMGVGIVYLTALYMLLPLYSALEKLPKSYTEVAADLGAGAWVVFVK